MTGGTHLLDALPDEERRALRAASRRRRFGKGDTIFHEGDPGDTLHILEKGHVAVRVSTALGDVVTLTILGPGQAFGDQALIQEHARRTASVVCLEPTETLSISGQDFGALRARLPAVDRFMVAVLSSQVHSLTRLLVDTLHLDAEHRVWRRLHDLAQLYDTDDGQVVLPMTQDDLATLAGTTRPTANKALRSAEELGIVELRRGRIIVTDAPALADRAGVR